MNMKHKTGHYCNISVTSLALKSYCHMTFFDVSKKVAKFIERKKAYCARFSNFMRFFVARDSS